MKKYEELLNLINTKHPEWKNLTQRKLAEVSGYSVDTSRQALRECRPNKTNQSTNQNKKKGSAGKRTKSPTNLTKIDESLLEDILLSVVNNGEWDLKLAREIQSFLDKKGALKQEQSVKTEFDNIDFMETVKNADAYVTGPKEQISE